MDTAKVLDKTVSSVNGEMATGEPIDALRALEVAIALGAEIPAPVKSFVYLATVAVIDEDDGRNDYTDTIGVYQSEVAAKIGLVGWILDRWSQSERAPWNDDLEFSAADDEYDLGEKNYLASKTDDEILQDYFSDSPDSYNITKFIIQGETVRATIPVS